MSTHRYSYSQLQVYKACGLKWKFRYQDSLVPLQPASEHDLRYGKAIDRALNALYGPGGDVLAAQMAFSIAYPESEYPAVLPNWSQGKSFAGGLTALKAYVAHYAEEDQHWEVVRLQNRDTETYDDRTLVLDLVIRDRRDGLIYGVDHKSTGKYLNKDYWPQFDPHSQVRQYVDSLQRQYGEVGGFYINAIGMRHRSKAYTPRTGPDKGVQLPAGDWYDFKRMVFNPNREAVTAEQDNFNYWVRRIEQDKASGQFGYNTEQCVRGPLVCEYHQICSAGWQWPRDSGLIESHYRQRCRELVGDERCQLVLGHEGEHDSTRPVQADFEVDLSEEIEEAEV
jgi:hypothetical protein